MAQVAGRQDEFHRDPGDLAATQQYAGQYTHGGSDHARAVEQAARAKAPMRKLGSFWKARPPGVWQGLCESNEAAVQQALSLDKSKQTQATAALARGGVRQWQVGVAVGCRS